MKKQQVCSNLNKPEQCKVQNLKLKQLNFFININMEQQHNPNHQQPLTLAQNPPDNTTLIVKPQISKTTLQPLTPIHAHQADILEYYTNQHDKQTLDALKMFKAIFNDKQEWNLTCKKWIRLKLKKVFENLSLARPKKIDLTQNQQPLLLDSLSCISTFPCLKELRLCNNKIASFEKLTLIDFPVLEELSLSDNDIVRIKCLKKINFRPQNIKKVSFYANRVQSLQPISRVNFVNTNPKSNKDHFKTAQQVGHLQKGLIVQKQRRAQIQQQCGCKPDEQGQRMLQVEQQSKQQIKGEQQEQQQVELSPLSLLFGINQIGHMQWMNKLQRQAIKPQQSGINKMGHYWQCQEQCEGSFDAEKYKNNRRLIFSVELNKQKLLQWLQNSVQHQLQLLQEELSPP